MSDLPIHWKCNRQPCLLGGFAEVKGSDAVWSAAAQPTDAARRRGAVTRYAEGRVLDWARDDAHDLLCGPERRSPAASPSPRPAAGQKFWHDDRVWAEYRAREAQLLRELRGHYGCRPVPLQLGWAVDLVEFTTSGSVRPIMRGQGPDPVAAIESLIRQAHLYRLPWKLPEAASPPPAPPAPPPERVPAPPPPPLPLDTDVRTVAYTSPATPTELARLGGRPLRSGDPFPWEDE